MKKTTHISGHALLAICLTSALLSACGQKGPLIMPEKKSTITTSNSQSKTTSVNADASATSNAAKTP